MFRFTGYLLNKHFGFTAAESPSDLYLLWKSDDDPPMEDMRCWVLLKTPGDSSVWVEVVLKIPNYFNVIKAFFEDEISIEFRSKGESSPKESDPPSTVQMTESLSTLGMTEGPATSTSNVNVIDFSVVVNDKDPFSLEKVEDIEAPLLLRFPRDVNTRRQDILCVSLDSFEQFVRAEAESGKNLIDLQLNRVMCKGGRELSFVLCKDVWLLSVLSSSQEMRNSFRKYLECSIERENQLRVLKQDKELWQRVLFWVSDFLDFDASSERITMPPEDGITAFMSPFYFSKEEGEMLGSLCMPNTTSLHDTMSIMLEGKVGSGALEVCASHDIAPVLLIGFQIKKGFHKPQNFKTDKKKWVKKRDKEMKKMMKK